MNMFLLLALLVLLLLILCTIFIKIINKSTNIFICILISIVISYMVLNPDIAINAAIKGSKLFAFSILPPILPFLTLCNLLIHYDGIFLYGKLLGPILCTPLRLSKSSSFPIVASFICGYPLGAKYSCDLYELGYIDRNEFIRLVNIASNPGPLFVIGAIGVSMLNNAIYGYIILSANYISALLIGFITLFKNKNTLSKSTFKSNNNNIPFSEALKISVENAINTTFSIGAYVILFSVLINIISNNSISHFIFNTLPGKDIVLSFLEMTNGASIVSNTSMNLNIKISLISGLCAFSGLCVITQVSSFLSKHKFPMKRYIFFKIIQGIIAFIISLILCKFLISTVAVSNITNSFNIIHYFFPFICLCSITIILYWLKKLFHIS